ncbi:MAG: hypothetical protein ACRCXC_13350 [Legionella sp.]
MLLFQKVPGLENITRVDVVNYPSQVKQSLAVFEKNPLVVLKQNPALQEQIVPQLSSYLQGPFLTLAASLFLDKDYIVLRDIMSQESNVNQFIQHLLSKAESDTNLDLGNFDVIVS